MGNRTIGKRAVAAIGTGSQIHHTAIQMATPMVLQPGSSRSVGGAKRKVAMREIGPRTQPKICLVPHFFWMGSFGSVCGFNVEQHRLIAFSNKQDLAAPMASYGKGLTEFEDRLTSCQFFETLFLLVL